MVIAVVGASGLVGQTFLSILEKKLFKPNELRLFSSDKNVGNYLNFYNTKIQLEKIKEGCFDGCDYIFLFCPSDISKMCMQLAKNSSGIIIDNSALNRMKKNVPLIVPVINGHLAKNHKVLANPNCTTAICALPLFAIQKEYKIESIIFCTYQSVSGSGKMGIKELAATIKGETNLLYKHNISKTCIPKIGEEKKLGYTVEEFKMIDETKKILNDKNIKISATCVRVPIANCHAISIYLKLEKNYKLSKIKSLLEKQKGVVLLDNIKRDIYPTAIEAYEKEDVFVGRIRRGINEKNTLLFYVVSDNLMRGAAYNAYEIMLNLINANDCM